MFELNQFTLDGPTKVRGDGLELGRRMRAGLEQAIGLGLPYHAVLVNPVGQVVATV